MLKLDEESHTRILFALRMNHGLILGVDEIARYSRPQTGVPVGSCARCLVARHLRIASSKTPQRAFRWTILYPKVQLLPIGYPRIGAAVDGVPAIRVPRSGAEAGKTNRSEVVRYAAAESLFIRAREQQLLHGGVIGIGAERRI